MFGLLVTHARMAFAFSRDGALPGSRCLHSNTMYAAINSFGVIGIYLSYLFPILLRVIRNDKFPRGPFHLGSWSVPVGVVAIIFLCFASVALVLPTVYTDPNEFTLADNVTLDHDAYVNAYLVNFNWAPVVVVAVFLISYMFWFFSAHKWFKGPPIDTETKWEKSTAVVEF
ncbi:hypothetical protein HDU79_011829 [Rhizoclosmatium sp. JEL0117]|nr:hypothetical protein HDU79_011829 [Rhizoclosmatium sp. JEL0117]